MATRKTNKQVDRELSGLLMPVLSDDMSRIAAEQVAKAARPRTAQELRTEQIMATLDELGGSNVGEDSIVFTGTQVVLPEDMAGKMDEVVRFLSEYDESQNAHFNISRAFQYRPKDVAAAFDRAMRRVFGTTGIGKAQWSFFGVTPPAYISVSSGPHGETIQVPWEKVQFSLIDADFYLEEGYSAEFGTIGRIRVEAPKRHRKRIEGFFRVVVEELRERSIYRGKAITAHPSEPQFIDLDAVDPARVVFTREVEEQLQVNVWAPLKYTEALRESGIPLKRAVLLHGPNGTGKTLAGGLAGQLAVANGWTYILVRAEDDPLAALTTARMYSPAIVMIEDLDKIAAASGDRNHVAMVLDRLDNVEAKGAEVMVVFTSNFAGRLDKSVIRPGRLDAVISVGELDAEGYERLVRALIPEQLLAGDVNFDVVCAAMEGFLPAFAVEAILRAMRYSIYANKGRPGQITTENLAAAARGMKDHIALMDDATHASGDKPVLDQVLGRLITEALRSTRGTFAPVADGVEMHPVLKTAAMEFDGGKS